MNTEFNLEDLKSIVRKIESRKHLWSSSDIRKESSPMIIAMLNSERCVPTIDEGSEINCIDAAFAEKCSLQQVPTRCSAKGAENNSMIVTGQTLDSIFLKIPHNDNLVWWSLSKCVVVKNLGVDIRSP